MNQGDPHHQIDLLAQLVKKDQPKPWSLLDLRKLTEDEALSKFFNSFSEDKLKDHHKNHGEKSKVR